MDLREFLKNINEMVEENPEILDHDVIINVDDYLTCLYVTERPSIGLFEDQEYTEDTEVYNVILIN